jgi:hypothetical protein
MVYYDYKTPEEIAELNRIKERQGYASSAIDSTKSKVRNVESDIANMAPDAVANISELSAVDDSLLADGTILGMLSLRDIWQLNRNSNETVDGITIIDTNSGSGRWIRKGLSDKSWTTQTAWYIDSLTGDDENDGLTEDTGLKTLSELARRWKDQTINVHVAVYVLDDTPASDYPRFRFTIGESGFVLFRGMNARAMLEWAFTAVTERDPANNQPNECTTNIGGSWTSNDYIGRRIRLTSGSNIGAVAWAAKDLDNDTARVSPWWTDSSVDFENIGSVGWSPWDFSPCEAGATDDFVIEELTVLYRLDMDVHVCGLAHGGSQPGSGGIRLVFEDLQINPGNPPGPALPQPTVTIRVSGDDFAWAMNRCVVGSVAPGADSVMHLVNCFRSLPIYTGVGSTHYYGGGFFRDVWVTPGRVITLEGGTLCEGNIYCSSGEVHVAYGAHGVCIMDTGSGANVVLYQGALFTAQGPVYGDADTGVGVQVDGGARFLYDSSKKPSITGSGGDTKVGGAVKTWAEIPFVDTAKMAGIVEM